MPEARVRGGKDNCGGRTVWVRNVVSNARDGPKWVPGEIRNRNSSVSYEVNVSGQVWQCHTEQMQSRSGPYHDTLATK